MPPPESHAAAMCRCGAGGGVWEPAAARWGHADTGLDVGTDVSIRCGTVGRHMKSGVDLLRCRSDI